MVSASVRGTLPQPTVISTSVWVYRFLMLIWALWLASALLKWLNIGWKAFAKGGFWREDDQDDESNTVVIDATSVSQPVNAQLLYASCLCLAGCLQHLSNDPVGGRRRAILLSFQHKRPPNETFSAGGDSTGGRIRTIARVDRAP